MILKRLKAAKKHRKQERGGEAIFNSTNERELDLHYYPSPNVFIYRNNLGNNNVVPIPSKITNMPSSQCMQLNVLFCFNFTFWHGFAVKADRLVHASASL